MPAGRDTIDASTQTPPIPKILVIDDEPRILNFVGRGLRGEGFLVDVCAEGAEGLRHALAERYDLVILDLLMPGLDGTAVLRSILAKKPQQSVIVLSALATTTSKVTALQLGAEDYLVKPFAFDELLARVHARLRSAAKSAPTHLVSSRLTLDVIRREADSGSGPVPLADREFLLLRELMRSAGRAVSKERLLAAVWGYHFSPESNVLDVYVGRLRAKLGSGSVITLRGRGYGVDVD
jgi:DNA-binding response OmpR family regulator